MDQQTMTIVFATLTALLMAIGLVGSIFPRVPGLSLLWTAMVVFALATRFAIVDLQFLLIVTALIALEVLLDFASALRGTKKFHVNIWGVAGAVVGAFVAAGIRSTVLFIILPLAGIIIGQLVSGHDALYKVELKGYTMLGYVGNTIMKVLIGMGAIGLFLREVLMHAGFVTI